MVAKVIALYKHPADKKNFDQKYFDEHVPMAKEIPGLQLIEISKTNGAPSGDAAYYLMAELYFDDMDAVKAGMNSPEGKAVRKDLDSFAKDLVTLMYAEVTDKN